MPPRKSAPKARAFSASYAVEIAGAVLREIKQDDNLTYAELGENIGKSGDQAERIAKGNAVMDMPTFLRCCMVFGSRFADRVLALTGLRTAPHGTVCLTDEKASHSLARLLPLIMIAEEQGETVERLRPHESAIRAVHETSGRYLEMISQDTMLRVVEGRR
jgi:predicted transcriptional regulator